MARKTLISREVILSNALEMLIKDGYSSINIKTLSQKIGCSTQPLVWHFENMDGLRKALVEYALDYANSKMTPCEDIDVTPFEQVGNAYIKIALHEPNLFKFVFLNGSDCYPQGGVDMFTKGNAELIKCISAGFGISEEKAGEYLQNTLIYTHGVATFVATGMICLSEEQIMDMINETGDNFLLKAGVPADKIPAHIY